MSPTITIVLAVLTFLGTATTGAFALWGIKARAAADARAAGLAAAQAARTAELEARSIGREEMDTALENQRQRLATLHGEYRDEIASILARHAREIEWLTLRAEAAEGRAQAAEDHATRCDSELASLRSAHEALRVQVEGGK